MNGPKPPVGLSRDEFHEVLSTQRYRSIIRVLAELESEESVPVGTVARRVGRLEDMSTDSVSRTLRHRHLPTLDDLDVAEWCSDTNCVRAGPNAEALAWYLTEVDDVVFEGGDAGGR